MHGCFQYLNLYICDMRSKNTMTMRILRACLLAVLLLPLSMHISAEQRKQQRFSIMGLGDSITEGSTSFTCYLYPLWEKLMTGGYEFDFIGPNNSPCRIGTLNTCGFGGKTVEFLDSKIDSLYRIYPADIVLLHAGHNHSVDEHPVPGMISAYRSIISKILAINPRAYIFMAEVIPSGKLPKYNYIPDLNKQIAKMVKSMNSSQVILVNQCSGFDWQRFTIADKVHPNKLGGEHMAAVWFKALEQILKPAPNVYKFDIVPYKTLSNADPLTLHIFQPSKRGGAKHPALIYFFGGGWHEGTPIQFYRECAYYAANGFVAVSADYRIELLHHSTPFDSFEDARDAMRWLRMHADKYNIDTMRIVASGSSAGGQLAAALGTIPNRDGGVSYRPGLMVLNYAVVDNGPTGYGTAQMKARYKEISPLDNITPATPPALFLLGTKDPLMPVATAKAFQQRMEQNGVYCELKLFLNAGHPIFLYRKPLAKEFYDVRKVTDAFLRHYHYLP